MKFSGVTILQGVKFAIFLLIFEWALQQCSGTALPVMGALSAADWEWPGVVDTRYGVKCAWLAGRACCTESRPELETVNK